MGEPVKLLVPDTSNEFGAREPTVEELVEALPEQFWDLMAGYLSTTEWIPTEMHPENMRLKLAEAVAAALKGVSE